MWIFFSPALAVFVPTPQTLRVLCISHKIILLSGSFVGAKLAAVQIQSTPIHLLTNAIVVHTSQAAKLYQHKRLARPLANNVYISTELKPSSFAWN